MAEKAAQAARECWHGGLPCVFSLHPDEVATLHKPRPYTMVLPRQSILPFVSEALEKHFAPFSPPMGGELWYEVNGVPLRWQIPIGVLFDLLQGEEVKVSGGDLPWKITVHFQSFPADQLLHATKSEAETVLLNALKESCYLRCGSAMPAMSLSPASQQTLASALSVPGADLGQAYASYTPVAELIEAAVRNQLGQAKEEAASGASTLPAMRAVPLRIFVNPTQWRQQPLPPMRAGTDDEPTTLRDALCLTMPAHFAAQADGDVAPPVLVQGVQTPLHTPLHWLWAACAHPDGWLYVCVSVPEVVDLQAAPDKPKAEARMERASQ